MFTHHEISHTHIHTEKNVQWHQRKHCTETMCGKQLENNPTNPQREAFTAAPECCIGLVVKCLQNGLQKHYYFIGAHVYVRDRLLFAILFVSLLNQSLYLLRSWQGMSVSPSPHTVAGYRKQAVLQSLPILSDHILMNPHPVRSEETLVSSTVRKIELTRPSPRGHVLPKPLSFLCE